MRTAHVERIFYLHFKIKMPRKFFPFPSFAK